MHTHHAYECSRERMGVCCLFLELEYCFSADSTPALTFSTVRACDVFATLLALLAVIVVRPPKTLDTTFESVVCQSSGVGRSGGSVSDIRSCEISAPIIPTPAHPPVTHSILTAPIKPSTIPSTVFFPSAAS
ncbi:hypothetical protein CC86DRAFT_182427 [Ophiobolus disseminans]|uniref:Uncharacterized protein n=1 Tax=Ophiobolus disseminans TaxID=1469910 RepID=A0A6A7AAB1_9PLEO|nr:hypothetical protein CC86DRAFT_182427 [Ophiobolus disseminans]